MPNINALLVSPASEGLSIEWVTGNKRKELGLYSVTPEGRSACLDRLADESIQNPICTLLLPSQAYMRGSAQFPEEALSNLREVFGFEIDRYTPFNADKVYFDARYVAHIKSKKKIEIEYVVSPRSEIESLIGQLNFFDFFPSNITPEYEGNALLNAQTFNLLPDSLQPVESAKTRLVTAGLSLFLIIGLISFIVYPSWYAKKEIFLLQEEIAEIQPSVRTVSNMRSSISGHVSKLNTLLGKENTNVSVTHILEEMAERLPSSSWLTQLRYKDGRVQIQGFSENATELIQLLDDSKIFEQTRFTSPLANRNGKQQAFKISLKVVERL